MIARSILISTLIALALAFANAVTLGAQSDNAYASPGWRVECENTGKTLDCKAVQQVVERDNNQVLAAMTIRVATDTKHPVMLIQLPLGIAVNEPVTVTLGALPSNSYVIQTCTQAGCFAGSPITDHTIDLMRTSTDLRIAFKAMNKQTVTVTMPLAGFGPVYDKIRQ